MRDRSLPEETGMGTLLRPKCVAPGPSGAAQGVPRFVAKCLAGAHRSLSCRCGRPRWSTAPDSCIPFMLRISVVTLGLEASESVPPPVAAPSPSSARPRSSRPRWPRRCLPARPRRPPRPSLRPLRPPSGLPLPAWPARPRCRGRFGSVRRSLGCSCEAFGGLESSITGNILNNEDELALDVAARQTAGDVAQAVALALRTTPPTSSRTPAWTGPTPRS